ncbi:hypothetical protein EDB80DRAFT_840886 [Ilyonectria destructans]|nr:hypothetical protein EDB80DRAFT_840886 [Ilyonectria destructans]
MAPPKIGRKKEGLREFLDRVEGTDDPEFRALCEESKKLDELARGYRWASPSTQLQQDQQLSLYCAWARSVFGESDDIDKVCFPDPTPGDKPFEQLFSQLRQFTVSEFSKCAPQATEDDAISYTVLVQHQRNLMFWVERKYRERDIEPPTSAALNYSLAEVMRQLCDRFGVESR